MNRWMWVRSALIACCLSIAPLPLFAQTPEKTKLTESQREEVARLLLEAKSAFSSKDYEVALDRLVSAYDLYPDANVQRRIGEALERLRRDRDALEVYRKVLARDDLDPSIRDSVERRVNFLDDLLKSRRATVRVTSERPETQIFVGQEEEPRGVAPLELKLDPGSYSLRAVSGDESVGHSLTLSEREKATWSPEWPVEVAKPVEPTDSTGSPVLGWTLVGLGAASYAAGATTLILASSEASTLDEYDAQRAGPRPADYSEVEDRHNTLITLSWIGAGVGTVLTGIGAYLLISGSSESDASTVSVAPTPGGGQVIWRSSW